MENAGILTLYYKNYNFGGLLQAYALPMVLRDRFGIDAEQICYSLYIEKKEYGDIKNKIQINNVIYKMGILFFSRLTEKKINRRKRVFEQFMDEIPHCKDVYDFQTIGKCLSKYQLLICGGDQIWNVCNGISNLNIFTLNFAPESIKKIAYAPSMAVLEIDNDGRKCMEQGLAGLKAISIREKRSINILKSITDNNIEIVVDPVLLLTKDEWNKELKKTRIKNKYILCYLINDNTGQREAVKRIAIKHRLQIVTFPHILANAVRTCELFFGDIRDYTSGPREFIGLIEDAEFVITDSFHACVFSMIFETPFVVFERNQSDEKGNMNSRIYDFLEEYHLENQLVTDKELVEMNDIPRVDYTYAHEHWDKRRKESLEYLERALKE